MSRTINQQNISRPITSAEALAYHATEPAGKISVEPSKPCVTQRDLSLAYTPGVAEPSRAIVRQPMTAYQYTNKGNLVAVISNGTATLGLGDIGALASKPVMEGKCVLFKRFAGIDAFDLELDSKDPVQFIETVVNLASGFGGINLEDIAAPDCFEIEDVLKRKLSQKKSSGKKISIPVFHDDQHGTAIISGAALLNALELTGKKIDQVKVVVVGAGAAGVRCAEYYCRLGVRKRNMWVVDQRGVLHTDRTDLTPLQKKLARDNTINNDRDSNKNSGTELARTLDEALLNADVLLGVSAANIITPDMIRTMATQPIIFTLANPDPEIAYPLAKHARPDAILATGRSDYPNQINNVLGFPFIFRGALDTQSNTITENMKLAATYALADLAHQPVPANVRRAYQDGTYQDGAYQDGAYQDGTYQAERMTFGPDYIVPKPFDQRVLVEVSYAVAKAAQHDGVAGHHFSRAKLKTYRTQLTQLAKQLQQKYL